MGNLYNKLSEEEKRELKKTLTDIFRR